MKYRLVCECALDWKNIIEYATSERTFIRPALAIRYCNVNLHALCVYSLYDSVVYSFFFMRFEKTWLFSACSSHT